MSSSTAAEQELTSFNDDDWLMATSTDIMAFKGSNDLFDFEVEFFAHLHQGKSIISARFCLKSIRRAQPPNRYLQCFLRLQVITIDADHEVLDFAPQSCLINNLHQGQLFCISFPNHTFKRTEHLSVERAFVRLEPVQFAIPAKYAVLAPSCLVSLNDPDLSDCSIVPKDSTDPIHVSRAILARASPFFTAMFKGQWAESIKSATPIQFGWSASALLPCLIHMYSGWVVGEPFTGASVEETGGNNEPDGGHDHGAHSAAADLVAKYTVDVGALTVHQLLELMDLARLLELPVLVAAANREMANALDVQFREVESDLKRRQVMVS